MPLTGTPTAKGIPNFGAGDRPALDLTPGLLDITSKIDTLLGLIAIGSTSGAGATLSVSGIPATGKHLFCVYETRADTTATGRGRLRLNGDTGANYHYAEGQAFASSATGGGAVGATFAPASGNVDLNAPANRFEAGFFLVFDYTNSARDKVIVGLDFDSPSDLLGGQDVMTFGGVWKPAVPVAVTAVSLTASAGGWVAASRLDVYAFA